MRLRSFVRRALLVVLAGGAGVGVEHAILALLLPAEASRLELGLGVTTAAAVFLVAMVPMAAVVTLLFSLAERRRMVVLAVVGFAGSTVLALSLTGGRHFASWWLRAPAVLAVGFVGALVGASLPRALRVRGASTALVVVAVAAWALDGFALRRTLAPLHSGFFACSLIACGFVAILHERRLGRAWVGGLVLALGALGFAPFGAPALRRNDALQIVLVERAPWSGRAVRLVALVGKAPPEPEADGPPPRLPTLVAEERSLDWSGHDVLLVTIDTLRADHLGAYGYARPTSPHFDALASEGALFLHAYSPIPHTSYSLVSLLTGRRVRPLLEHGDGAEITTFAGELRAAGYTTGAFYPPAVFYVDPDRFSGFMARGLDFDERTEEFADPATRAKELAAWIGKAPPTPIFAWVHLFEPHEPYEPHPDHVFGDTDEDAYDGEVAAADDGLGELVGAMRAARPDAVIVVSADHGEEFEDHGGHFHGATAYEEQVRIPLLVVAPGVPPRRIDQPVQLVDVLPTVLAALGQRRPSGVEGRDLGQLTSGRFVDDDPGAAYVESDSYEMVAHGSLRLVCARASTGCQLFDVGSDPHEQHDLGGQRAADMRRLKQVMTTMKDTR